MLKMQVAMCFRYHYCTLLYIYVELTWAGASHFLFFLMHLVLHFTIKVLGLNPGYLLFCKHSCLCALQVAKMKEELPKSLLHSNSGGP